MAQAAAVPLYGNFSKARSMLKVLGAIGGLVIAVAASWLAVRAIFVIGDEGDHGFFTGAFGTFSVILGLLVAVWGCIRLFGDEDKPRPWFWTPIATYALLQWVVLGVFYLLAGPTYTLSELRSPWLTRDGHVYMTGEEVPHGYLRASGAQVEPKNTYTIQIDWTETGASTGVAMNMQTTVTLSAELVSDKAVLERTLHSVNGSDPGFRQRALWSLADERVPSEGELLGRIRAQQLSVGNTFPSGYEWLSPFRVTNIQTRLTQDQPIAN